MAKMQLKRRLNYMFHSVCDFIFRLFYGIQRLL